MIQKYLCMNYFHHLHVNISLNSFGFLLKLFEKKSNNFLAKVRLVIVKSSSSTYMDKIMADRSWASCTDDGRRQHTVVNISNNIYLIILVESHSLQRYYLVRFFVFCFENGSISTYGSFITIM